MKSLMFVLTAMILGAPALSQAAEPRALVCNDSAKKSAALKLPVPPNPRTSNSSFKFSGHSAKKLECTGGSGSVQMGEEVFQRKYVCMQKGTTPYYRLQVVTDIHQEYSVIITRHFQPAVPPAPIGVLSNCKVGL